MAHRLGGSGMTSPATGSLARRAVRRVVPANLRAWVRLLQQRRAWVPPVGLVRLGSLRRLDPISREFGFDRGTPVDRHYIEAFLARHAADVRGRVLEIKDDTYARRYGAGRPTHVDVLCLEADDPHATMVGDLADAPQIPSAAFDCVVVTQTLQLVYDVRAAVTTLHRILKPGGVLLATVPGITQVSPHDEWGAHWSWSFTGASVRRLLGDAFGPEAVQVETHGNVTAAVAQLHGLAAEDLSQRELAHHDPEYQVSICARAVKA